MATFTHGSGVVLSSKRVTIKDAVVNGSDTQFTVDQPKNSTLDSVFIKVTGAVDLDSNATIGFAIGDAAGENDIFADDNLFLNAGQEIPVGTVYKINSSTTGAAAGALYEAAAQSSRSVPQAFSSSARKLHAFIDNPSVAVSDAGTFEIHFQFAHFAD